LILSTPFAWFNEATRTRAMREARGWVFARISHAAVWIGLALVARGIHTSSEAIEGWLPWK
jgi:hypothetical protein